MSILELLLSPAVVIIIVVLLLATGVKILREYERAVIFRLGRVAKAIWNPGGSGNGPGIVLILPGIDKIVKVPLRTVTMDVPPQDIITRDNVSVKVNAIIYFRVIDAQRAILQVEDYLYATSQIAQTTLRSVLGQSQLDDLLAKREEINANLQRIIDQQTEPWGIKVAMVEVKNVDLPQDMIRAIAKQAEAERERRAKVIHAEGEYQAAQRLSDSAEILSRNPAAIQLRFLQTLAGIATDKNSVTIFPVPIDLLTPFLKRGDKGG
ncbi:MAG TPA: slipin family protein [Nitrospiria bacterium]|jgi:regulator of protease activity HflC (stomatin/prohibitin superfamily)|nr:slipin family protein [Nitrospiria bacterium]